MCLNTAPEDSLANVKLGDNNIESVILASVIPSHDCNPGLGLATSGVVSGVMTCLTGISYEGTTKSAFSPSSSSSNAALAPARANTSL